MAEMNSKEEEGGEGAVAIKLSGEGTEEKDELSCSGHYDGQYEEENGRTNMEYATLTTM